MNVYLKSQLYRYGRLLRQIRELIGLSQQEAAEIIGIDPGNLNRYESGKVNMSLAMLVNILDSYGWTLHFCIDIDDIPGFIDSEKGVL